MLQKISELVKQCGEMILSADHIRDCIAVKPGSSNYVTRYDVAVQEFLQKELLYLLPQAAFIGEENGAYANAGAEYAFIVDPIDGTTNFIKGYPRCAVSVGLSHKGKMELGMVYNPFSDELFVLEHPLITRMRRRSPSLWRSGCISTRWICGARGRLHWIYAMSPAAGASCFLKQFCPPGITPRLP